MPPEVFKQVMDYVGLFGLGGIFGGVIVWFIANAYLPAYFSAKGKNLATKEDIGAITTEVEGVKNKFAVQIKELEHQKTLLSEGFKSSLLQQQEFARTTNAAVVELTKKLAAGSQLISWLSWNATQPDVVFVKDDFTSYDKAMIIVLGDLVGLQATVAALDSSKSDILSPFANQLYEHDIEVAKARNAFLKGKECVTPECIDILKPLYEKSIDFDKALLAKVTNLLRPEKKSAKG